MTSLFYRNFLCLLFLLWGTQGMATNGQVQLQHNDLTLLGNQTIQVTTPNASLPWKFENAHVYVRFDMGEDYDLGNNAFGADVEFRLIGKIGGVPQWTEQQSLNLNERQPEAVFRKEMTASWAGVTELEIELVSYTNGSPHAQNAVRFFAGYESEYTFKGSPNGVSTPIVTQNPVGPTVNFQAGDPTVVNFNWTSTSSNVPTWQFQLLRVYNTLNSGLYGSNPQFVEDLNLDWSSALILEMEGGKNALSLTVSEGTGYYLWRVRPIGNYYPGGIADSRNWGVWSANPTQVNFNGVQSIPAYAFYYEQFEADRNWSHARIYTEESRIAEQMTWANGIGQAQQTQRRIPSAGKTVTSEQLYDFAGRAALQTLPVPLDRNHFGYEEELLMRGANKYTTEDFDGDVPNNVTWRQPLAITDGPLAEYWSSQNPDPSIPDAEGFPYARSLYYMDGTNRLREQGSPGKDLRIGGSHNNASRTTQILHSSVADVELVRIFSDEAPDKNSVQKVIALDPNKVATVSYVDKSGQTIATCLSHNGNSLMEEIGSEAAANFTVTEVIDNNVRHGASMLSAGFTVALTEAGTLELDFSLTPNSYENECVDICRSCDYEITFQVKREDDPFDPLFPKVFKDTVAGNDCPVVDQNRTISVPVQAGSYLVERIVRAYNDDPNSSPTRRYVDQFAFDLNAQLDAQLAQSLGPIYTSIANGDLAQFNQDMDNANYPFVPGSPGVWQVPVNSDVGGDVCFTVEVPRLECDQYECPNDAPDFEQYIIDRWANTSYAGTSITDFMPQYAAGELNTMVSNMLTVGNYDCQDIWNCWNSVVQTHATNLDLQQQVPGYAYDPLDAFLTCTGYQLVGISQNPSGSTGYLEHAYAYFNYTLGSSPDCETAYCGGNCNAADFTAMATTVGASGLSELEEFMRCTRGAQPAGTPAPTTGAQASMAMTTACSTACQSRFPGFVDAVVAEYHGAQLSVQGDVYDAQGNPLNGSFDISMQEVYCAAERLVNLCTEGCQATVTGPYTAGTASEIAAMRNSMTADFELEFPQGGGCNDDEGYGLAGNPPADQSELALRYLNDQYMNLWNSVPSAGLTWNFQNDLNDFMDPDLPSGACTSTTVNIDENQLGKFVLDGCELTYEYYTDATGGALHWNNPNLQLAGSVLLCEDFCNFGSASNCPAFCLRWFTIDGSEFETLPLVTCDEEQLSQITNLIGQQVSNERARMLAGIEDMYDENCLDNYQDHFTVSYVLNYHHYMLYYYDRAGNLVRTVPPAGVVIQSPIDRTQHEPHRLVTRYRYNSLGQLVESESPDELGANVAMYDAIGRVRFARNAKQNALTTNKPYNYTRYDQLGRIVEVGESTEDWNNLDAQLNDQSFPQTAYERTYTVYSEPANVLNPQGQAQRFLENNISFTYNDEGVYTYYSYDPHGNVEWLIQSLPELGSKFMEYEYDLVSGNVLQLKYQEGELDQFFYRYQYDADNRITAAETSLDGVIWDRDAQYAYYDHGSLKRVLTGEDKVQGCDFVYTIQGWIKAMNHASLDVTKDPGADGAAGSNVARDAFGTALTFYDGDFVHAGSYFDMNTSGSDHLSPTSAHGAAYQGLYNGNIAAWASRSYDFSESANQNALRKQYTEPVGMVYKYDVLNRIRQGDFHVLGIGNWSATGDYGTAFAYDPIGNLVSLDRDAHGSTGTREMDRLKYWYEDGQNGFYAYDPSTNSYVDQGGNALSNTQINDQNRNRLAWVDDSEGQAFGVDLDDQNPDLNAAYAQQGVYEYDEIGQLVRDDVEGNDVAWTTYHKVDEVNWPNAGSQDIVRLDFGYDAAQQRVIKRVEYQNPAANHSTYYVKDASGNTVAVYEKGIDDASGEASYKQRELTLFGTERLGMLKRNVEVLREDLQGNPYVPNAPGPAPELFARELGDKYFELKDHLGNVRAVATDHKMSDVQGGNPEDFHAELVAMTDYYPFGMEMPGMSWKADGYRYGFQGQERDDELKGEGNSYDFGARMYDPRLGRWGSRDPLEVKYPEMSTYGFVGNMPIMAMDPDGRKIVLHYEDKKGKKRKLKVKSFKDLNALYGVQEEAVQDFNSAYRYTMTGIRGRNWFLETTLRKKNSKLSKRGNKDIHSTNMTLGTSFWEYTASRKQTFDIYIDYEAKQTTVNPNKGSLTWNPKKASIQINRVTGSEEVATQTPAVALLRETIVLVHISMGAHFFQGSPDGFEELIDQPGWGCIAGSKSHSGRVDFHKYSVYRDSKLNEVVNFWISDMSIDHKNIKEDRFLPGIPTRPADVEGPTDRPLSTSDGK